MVEAGASTTAAFTPLLVENVQRKYEGNWQGVYRNFTGLFYKYSMYLLIMIMKYLASIVYRAFKVLPKIYIGGMVSLRRKQIRIEKESLLLLYFIRFCKKAKLLTSLVLTAGKTTMILFPV